MCRQQPTSCFHHTWRTAHNYGGCPHVCGSASHHPLPRGSSSVSTAAGLCPNSRCQHSGAALALEPVFRHIYGNSFRAQLRQLLGLAEVDQRPEYKGTLYAVSVIDSISLRLPAHLRAPWAEWHKKDAARQWATIWEMPVCPLNTPHVTPDGLHQIDPRVLWSAADLVATPQQKFPSGSPTNMAFWKVPVQQAPRVLEASTIPIGDGDYRQGVLDKASPPWAPPSVLALHLAAGLRDPMSSCTPQAFIGTPVVHELSLAVSTASSAVQDSGDLTATTPPDGGFLPGPDISTLSRRSCRPVSSRAFTYAGYQRCCAY